MDFDLLYRIKFDTTYLKRLLFLL